MVYAITSVRSSPRTRKVVGETSAREADSDLGVNTDGAANGGDEWAGSCSHQGPRKPSVSRHTIRVHARLDLTREVRLEALDFLAVVGEAVPSSDTIITTAEEDAAATSTKLCEQVAHRRRVVERNGLLVITVTSGELEQSMCNQPAA